jgi:hypothetical protein
MNGEPMKADKFAEKLAEYIDDFTIETERKPEDKSN